MNRTCLLLVSAFIALLASTAVAAPLPTGLDKLQMYAGTWKAEIGHLDTPYSKVGEDSTTIKNDCWRSGDYYVCNQYVDSKQKVLLVYTYDAKDNTYTVYPIMAGVDTVQPGKLIIHANAWFYPWETTEKGQTTYFHVIHIFTAPDTIEYREEYSRDQRHWAPMAQGFENKIDK